MNVDERAVIAAGNNADLYEAIFLSHGLRFERLPFAFVGKDRPPPYYSNLTVLSAAHDDDIVILIMALAEQFEGRVGLKDSFCQLDIEENGFRVLFSASWIWRESQKSETSCSWQIIENEADLLLWEEAWKKAGSPTEHRMFKSEMLDKSDIYFLGQKADGEFKAGCIANASADSIGLSNVFSRSDTTGLFSRAAAAVESLGHKKPIVGYESGGDLDNAMDAGFETVGDLRILVAEAAVF